MYVQVTISERLTDFRIEGIGGHPGREPEAIVHAHFHHPDVFMALTPEEARTIAGALTRAAYEADAAYAAARAATPKEATV